ncbi:protein starmaker-like [Megalobrama amblycephala]|uniref:protein starmaker-like n=1 Tax=Megalobrama amblycephala TaxID=75352 RepID=UPI0020142FF2|nr:protein starmaker-like [Megalobrama amblycephala]
MSTSLKMKFSLTISMSFYIDLVRRSLSELTRYSLTPGPEHNPLLSMLAWNADYWSITFNASGEFLEIAFYPVYFNGPSAERVETSTSESSSDDEQPGPSHQVNNRSEIRTGGSSMNRSSTDDEQPGPSHRVNNRSEIGSKTPADQSSGSQTEITEGVKRKRKTSGRSKSREQKNNRSNHHSDSDSSSDSLSAMFSPPSLGETSRDDDQPGPSHRDNSEARASADQSSRDELRRGGKRKTSEHPDAQSKRRRSDH